MKTYKILITLFLGSVLLYSCSDDEITGGGDPGGNNISANLFITNNTNGNITVYDFVVNQGIQGRSVETSSTDSEGIYFYEDSDELLLVSRSGGSIDVYDNITSGTAGLSYSSLPILASPRDMAVNGNIVVVSDNTDLDGDVNTAEGRFFIFTKSAGAIELRNTITVNFAVWGIEFVGDDLFAVVDKTGDIAQFVDFASNTTDSTVAPNKRITVEGIVRTHGIAYDGTVMVLTDIGEATGNSASTDGGFQIINNFLQKFNVLNDGETLSLPQSQIRVSGNFTQLGNPIAVDYDRASATVFITERANDGGQVLFFDNIEIGGNLLPTFSAPITGASSLYFHKR